MRGLVARAASFNGRYSSVADAKTYRQTVRKMREFRADLQRRDEEERQRIASLTTNAGEQGVDETGAQIDRRQFYETRKLLERIAASQGLHYERSGRKFWDDLTDMIVADKKYVLPNRLRCGHRIRLSGPTPQPASGQATGNASMTRRYRAALECARFGPRYFTPCPGRLVRR